MQTMQNRQNMQIADYVEYAGYAGYPEYAEYLTADGAYHCPVGSIWLFLTFTLAGVDKHFMVYIYNNWCNFTPNCVAIHLNVNFTIISITFCD